MSNGCDPSAQRIVKTPGQLREAPNLADYEHAQRTYSWGQGRAMLSGLPEGRGLNIAHEAVDRHAAGPRAGHPALRWIDRSGHVRDHLSYEDLRKATNRFANVLRSLGVGRGERVFTLLESRPEVHITALGTLKNVSVFCPLFTAFGPEPIRTRLKLGSARVLVTTASLYRQKIEDLRSHLPALQHVILLNDMPERGALPGTHDWQCLMADAPEAFEIPATDPEDVALLHFTSGTTGQPKGAIHVHEAVVAHHLTGRLALDLHPNDVFWCTADPGWVTGISYGIIAPLTSGITSIVTHAGFDPERWMRLLAEQRITVWYTAPTALRMLMTLGPEGARHHDLRALRFAASAGEPLDPGAVLWSRDALGVPVHDGWWQTETGAIMIANYAAMDIRPGSMGRPLPGIEAGIVVRTGTGGIEVLEEPDRVGELALRIGWPSMFRGYLGDQERYRACFANGWYLTGDLASRDRDGFFWFKGRNDDVIKSAGHLIGPFEVESALLAHPAVAEAGVVGRPHPIAGEMVEAFVSLKPGFLPSETLNNELLAHARKRLGAAIAPRKIVFQADLPKTESGKILRRQLRAGAPG